MIAAVQLWWDVVRKNRTEGNLAISSNYGGADWKMGDDAGSKSFFFRYGREPKNCESHGGL